jgi:class 3 adenylate cyclase
MFCDIVDSTALSSRVDPEVYSDCILAYHQLGSVVADHGGSVQGYLGDGLLAVFGWPTAHEREADLAVHAGRTLLAELETLNAELERTHHVRLVARIGIHSGLAVVGRIGGPDRTDAAAFGETINIAARVQSVAAPGTVAITGETKRVLRDRWVLQSRGHPTLRGITTGFEVFEVIVPMPAFGPDVERVGPLVGRDAEVTQLRAAWSQATKGSGSVVILEGEPGVGKSRLAYELQQLVQPQGQWVTIACSPRTVGTPFGPFAEIIESLTPVHGRSPEERRADLLNAIVGWALGLATDYPAVLHIEDLHWADPSTEEVLERIDDGVGQQRLLLLVNTRPGGASSWVSRSGVRTIRLEPLGDVEIHSLVESAAGGLLTDDVVNDIVERADGLPLFADQLVAAMLTAAGRIVPATLQASLMARLDQLGAELRTIAQQASAIGRTFDDELVVALMGPTVDTGTAIERLVEAGIIGPVRGGEHRFRHALLQDAAYESMLHRERKGIHARIAGLLRERSAAAGEQTPALIGHHLAEAGDPEAALWFERAGTEAARAAAFEEAAGHLRRALELVSPDDASVELRLQIELANTLFGGIGYAAADTLPIWQRACDLAASLGNTEELTSALNGEATYWLQNGACRKSQELAEWILAVGQSHDLRVASLRGHCTLALTELFLGDAVAAAEHSRLALALYQPGDFDSATYGFGTDEGVIAYGVGGAAAWLTGYPDRGVELTESAVKLGASVGSAISELLGRIFKGMVHHLRGEHELAQTEAQVLVAEGSRFRLPFMSGFGHLLLGSQRAVVDHDPDAVAEVLSGMEQLAIGGAQTGAPLGFALLTEAHLAVGDAPSALTSATDGIALADTLDQHFFDAELLRLQAKAMHWSDTGSRDAVVHRLYAAVENGAARGLIGLALRAACDLGALSPESSLTLVAELLSRIEGGHSTADHRRARQLLQSSGVMFEDYITLNVDQGRGHE